MEDPENCRFFVRNWRYMNDGTSFENTSDIVDKVIIRYKTTGINCGNDIMVPSEMQDLIVAKVVYKFAVKNIPVKLNSFALNAMEREVDRLQEEYETLMYEPHNFWEVKDTIFSTQNSTARR